MCYKCQGHNLKPFSRNSWIVFTKEITFYRRFRLNCNTIINIIYNGYNITLGNNKLNTQTPILIDCLVSAW